MCSQIPVTSTYRNMLLKYKSIAVKWLFINIILWYNCQGEILYWTNYLNSYNYITKCHLYQNNWYLGMAWHPKSTGAFLLLIQRYCPIGDILEVPVSPVVLWDIKSLDCIYHFVEFSNIGQSLWLFPDISLLKPKN